MNLGKVGNTQFKVSSSFLFLVSFILFSYIHSYDSLSEALIQGLSVIFLLSSVLVCHEMGHIKAAEKVAFAKGESTLTLWALGGLAEIASLNEANPKQDLITTLAGPAVNLVFALVSLPILWAIGIRNIDDILIQYDPDKSYLQFFMSYFFILNVFTGVFNMLPGFPMDGGRTLRSILSMKMSYLRATTIAVYVALVVGVLMILTGLWLGFYIVAPIGIFVILASLAELGRVRRTAAAENGLL